MKPETQKALKVGALGVGANILGTAGFLEVESLFDNSHTSVGLAMGILTAATIFGLSYFAGYIAEESNPRHRGFHMDAVGIHSQYSGRRFYFRDNPKHCTKSLSHGNSISNGFS